MTDQPYRHVNETSDDGRYLPRERIPGETYRGTFAEPAGPDITMEQIEQAVAVVLERFEIEPLAAGELIGVVIEARDAAGGNLVDVVSQVVHVVSQAAAEHGYPTLDAAAFCQVVIDNLVPQDQPENSR